MDSRVVLGFMTLLTCRVISVAFYSEREKSDKFCSEALISAWGSFTCRRFTARDPRLYFPSEGSHTQDFYALKKYPSTPAGFQPASLGSSGEYDTHGTTGVDQQVGTVYMVRSVSKWIILFLFSHYIVVCFFYIQQPLQESNFSYFYFMFLTFCKSHVCLWLSRSGVDPRRGSKFSFENSQPRG